MKQLALTLTLPPPPPRPAAAPLPPRHSRVRRSRAKPARKPPAPEWLAWRCVVLAVDTASTSGWAIRKDGRLLYSGELRADDASEIDATLALALRTACGVPTVLVLERAWGRRTATLLALGAARAYWLAGWARAEQSKARIVSVYPASWRARVLGNGMHCARREVVRPVELAAAQAEVGSACVVGEDEAAAILISRWGARAAVVGKCLPARVRALSAPLPALKDKGVPV